MKKQKQEEHWNPDKNKKLFTAKDLESFGKFCMDISQERKLERTGDFEEGCRLTGIDQPLPIGLERELYSWNRIILRLVCSLLILWFGFAIVWYLFKTLIFGG